MARVSHWSFANGGLSNGGLSNGGLSNGGLSNGGLSAWALAEPRDAAETVELDPLHLMLNASLLVQLVVLVLIVAFFAVLFITVLKYLQWWRLRNAERSFEEDAFQARNARELFDVAHHHREAPGARVVMALRTRRDVPSMMEAIAKRAVVEETTRMSKLMPLLATIGSAAPFLGLFGTVWGIMVAFLQIGKEKSASLPVVAPAIGEALIATLVGLIAAIPAVIFYNLISKLLDDLISALEVSAEGWVSMVRDAAAVVHDEPRASLPVPLANVRPGPSTPPPLPQY